MANVQELLGKKVLVAGNGSPVQRVDRSDEMLAATARCQAVAVPDGGVPPPADPWSEQGPTELEHCQSEWSELYVAALRKAYPQADAGAVSKTYDDDGRTEDIEVLMAASHNAAIEAIVAAKKKQVEKQKNKDLTRIRFARNSELFDANVRMREELAQAEQERQETIASVLGFLRAVGAGVSAGLGGAGAALNAPSSPSYVSQPGCLSDFDCGFGLSCVKQNYSSNGVCLKEVNSYGVQTFGPPRSNSVMPKFPRPGDCHGNLDCPIGFQCDLSSGACVR